MSESYAIRCPACGEWQSCLVTTLTEYVFSCRREDCGKRRLMKHVNEAGLQANCQGPFKVTEVGKVVARLNAKGQIRDFVTPLARSVLGSKRNEGAEKSRCFREPSFQMETRGAE